MKIDKDSKELIDVLIRTVDYLKLYKVPENSFHVLLFFLVLRKENLLPTESDKSIEDLDKEFNSIHFANSDLKNLYNSVYDEIIFSQLGSPGINNMLAVFNSIDLKVLDTDFQLLFDSLLYRLNNQLGIKSRAFTISTELAVFMNNILDKFENPTVYNPFSSLGSLHVFSSYHDFICHEPDKDRWAIGALRAIAYKKASINITNSNPINEWPESNFDIIVAAPPFGNIKNFVKSFDTRYKSIDLMIIDKGLKALNADGKMVVLVPNSFLSQDGLASSLRQTIVDDDILEMIVSLPSGALENTLLKASILVLNKAKSVDRRNQIIMVNGEEFTQNKIRNVRLNYDSIIKLIAENDNHNGLRYIKTNHIDSKKFNLEIERYFWGADVNLQAQPDVTDLGTLLEKISFRNANAVLGNNLKCISIKHLQNDPLDYTLKQFEKKEVDSSMRNYGLIKESCMMVAKVGANLKPTYFNYTGEPLLVSTNIMCFKINNSKIHLSYLFNELYSEFIIEQLGFHRKGVAQSMLPLRSFLEIKIKVPALNHQRLKIENVKEAYIKSREKELNFQREILGLKDEAFREFASIRHTFRQYLNSLKSNVSGTKKFIIKNQGEPISPNKIYSKNLNQTFEEHLDSLENTINSMSMMLETFDQRKDFKKSKEANNLVELLKESVSRFKDPEKFTFDQIHIIRESFDMGGEYLMPEILFNKEDFFIVFSNIISNAQQHGFRGRDHGNVIKCELWNNWNNNEYVLEISNNGLPFTENFSFEKLITRGEKTTISSGSGMGGADISSILKFYSAKFDIINNPSEEFPVIYKIAFPHQYHGTL